MRDNFFSGNLKEYDSDIANLIDRELNRQRDQIELIASENIVSKAVLEAQGSVLTNKYAEGYPGARYYGGCEFVDEIEIICQNRVKELYGCDFANVQSHSGSQANQEVYFSLLSPGDCILGMSLDAGGHLTHGGSMNLSGKVFDAVTYGLNDDTGYIDMEEVAELAKQHRPKLIIAGASAYSRIIDFAEFRKIANSVGAYLLADVSHYSGLIVSGLYPSPFPHAHIVTSTTHKTLRGPRGAVILTNDAVLFKKVNSTVFPGMQGGPLMHVIAAKAVAFKEALSPDFKLYNESVLSNARALAKILEEGGVNIISGGTDCHMLLVDLSKKGVTGKEIEHNMEMIGLTCNKNTIPNDPRSPFITSGIRLGTAAATTRGLGQKEFMDIGHMIINIIEYTAEGTFSESVIEKMKIDVSSICKDFPIY